MIIDTSVLLAILYNEDDAEALQQRIAAAPVRKMSAGSLLEALLAVSRRKGDAYSRQVEVLVVSLGIDVVPFTEQDALAGGLAFLRYGKGRHPARLNFGDCMTYALARQSNEPLLFKGDDFVHTDLQLA